MAISQYTPLQLACTIVRIHKRLEDISWDELNQTWLNFYSYDRRYRIYWCACIGDHAIFRIGKLRILLKQRVDGCVFARWINDDILADKPCWKVTPTGDSNRPYMAKWQGMVLI